MAEIDWILVMNFAQRSGCVVHFLVEPHGRLLGVNFLHISRRPARTAGHVERVQPASTKQFALGSVLAFILLTFRASIDEPNRGAAKPGTARTSGPLSFIFRTKTTRASIHARPIASDHHVRAPSDPTAICDVGRQTGTTNCQLSIRPEVWTAPIDVSHPPVDRPDAGVLGRSRSTASAGIVIAPLKVGGQR